MKNEVKMSKEKMQTYEDIRRSGVTNMFNVTAVIALSEGLLTEADCKDIMYNYEKYIEEFFIV